MSRTVMRRHTIALLAAAVLAPMSGAHAAPPNPVGTYRMGGHDVASELVLTRDGKFTYFLAAGSLDEQAAGTWSIEGSTLHLVTLPKPVAAVFAAGKRTQTKSSPLIVQVVAPNGEGIAAVDLQVGFDSGAVDDGYTQTYGWSLPEGEKRIPRWVEFTLPIYALKSQRFAITDLAGGNELTFVLTPNDLGRIDFATIPIDIAPDRLTMHRWGNLAVFERAQGTVR